MVHRRQAREDPYNKVAATIGSSSSSSKSGAATEGTSSSPVLAAGRSRKFLIASFPQMREVAYCQTPDNVWRPLVIGSVKAPGGIAVDVQGAKLFVADPPSQAIWWYQLTVTSGGFLETTGVQHAAVEGVQASFLTVNSVGDLYFTGRMVSSASNASSVFRQDARKIAMGNAMSPVDLYTRSNSGSPVSKVWVPSGIAVDSVNVFWGNMEDGTSHGSVVKGSRENIGLLSQEKQMHAMSYVADDVRGVCATGTHVFYLSSAGVHGVLKSSVEHVGEPATVGLVATNPRAADASAAPWNPTSIAWDGDNSLYFTEPQYGVVYMLPALNVMEHNLTKYVDAPGAYGITFIGFSNSNSAGGRRLPALVALAVLSLLSAGLAGGGA
mmetsp:Transcript_164234/g.522305  ORF Transcript_164234/g.522305 Transcript_164234/m.522305 type:complete len:382 (+) Transcript_164234:112-1257(+)